MIETMELSDPSVVSPFLRQDIIRNCGMLASIERNIPPFPRTIWAARGGDTLVGAMLVTDGPGQAMVSVRTAQTDALLALLACLEPGWPYSFSIPAHLLEAFLQNVRNVVYKSQTVVLSARREDLRPFPLDLDYRQMGPADRPATLAFPESGTYEPPLAMYLDWALARPEGLAMYGLFDGDRLVGHIGWAVQIDHVWEATFLRVLSTHQSRGLAKALVARSTCDMMAAGRSPLYELNSNNEASLRVALATGYHELGRIHHYEGTR